MKAVYVCGVHVTTDHVTTDHVTIDHVTTDHVTTDHVTTDHVTTDTSALYVTIVQWETLQVKALISLFLFLLGETSLFIACCSNQEAHSQLMTTVLSCSQSNPFPPC